MNEPLKVLWPGWETVRLIGYGSFGAVYEIEREVFGHKEKAALKLLTIPQGRSDIDDLLNDGYDEESITARFAGYLQDIVREYSLMADMKGCANIVYCDDVKYVQHDDGIGWDIFIKMELLTPLPKALGKSVSEEQVVRIGADICSALVFCEKRNLLHRDIKPQNIFVASDGTCKLGDFGIAKTAERTTGGTKTGTYKYMAPEVYNNQPYGGKADIYSLGLVLYWLLNERRTPFLPLPPATPSSSDEDRARARRFAGEQIPPPARGSEELQRIVLKACAYDPAERYQSAEELLSELLDLDAAHRRAGPARQRETSAPAEETPARADVPGGPTPVSAPREIKTATPQSAQRPTAPLAGEPRDESTVYDAPAEDEGTVGIFHTSSPAGADAPGGPIPVPAPRKIQAHTPQSAKRPTAPLAGEPSEDATVSDRTAYTPKAAKPAPQKQKEAAPAAPVKKKKLPKWIPLVAVLAIAAVLLIVLLPKSGGSKAPAAAKSDPKKADDPALAADGITVPFAANLTMGTGVESGTYYAVGGVLGNYISPKIGVSINVVASGGSAKNLTGMCIENIYDLATVQSDVMTYAYNGTNSFAETGKLDGFRVLCGLYAETVQIATCDPSIKSVTDLKGKSVCVGVVGSGTYFNAVDILAAYDMTLDDITAIYESFGALTESLRDGKIDAAFTTAGAPTPSIVDLASANTVYLVSIDDAHMSKLLAACPWYAAYTIPAGTYKGQDADAVTVTVKATLICRADLDDDVAYKIVSTIFDNTADIAALHAKGAELSLDFATDGIAVPFAAGAAKYFAEKGIAVATAP